jgi:hypothetical protein
MPLTTVTGDPTKTRAQTLLFGHNARGKTELGTLETALLQRSPAAFAAYGKQCRAGRIKPGEVWVWRDSRPALGFMVVRESQVGATRLRYVQAALLRLARDYRLDGIKSAALAPLGSAAEWAEIRLLIDSILGRSRLPVVVYESYQPGVQADEPDLTGTISPDS